MRNLKESCQIGASTPTELMALLESYRESAGVSIQILVKVLLPQVPARTYKAWMANLADGEHSKNSYPPNRLKHTMLVRAAKALSACLDSKALPKSRAEIYEAGNRVTSYKKETLKTALKAI